MTARHIELSIYASQYSAEPCDWQSLRWRAQMADAARVDRIIVGDHVVFGNHLEAYGDPKVGGRVGGVQPTGPDGLWLEPLTTLSVLAGITERIRLGTAILLAALRRPVVLAKSAATLEVLSGGRLDLGVGVGWQREEYDAAGLDFSRRGRLLDHTLEVCQALWSERIATYASPELQFEHIHMMPKPLQPGGIPIWIAGSLSDKVVARVARFGTRWLPWGLARDDLESGISGMRSALERQGLSSADLEVSVAHGFVYDGEGAPDFKRTLAAVPRLVDLGVTDVRVDFPFASDSNQALDELMAFVDSFRTLTR